METIFEVGPRMKRGRGEETFEVRVYRYNIVKNSPYMTTPLSVVRPGLEVSIRSANNRIRKTF